METILVGQPPGDRNTTTATPPQEQDPVRCALTPAEKTAASSLSMAWIPFSLRCP
ncbi:hypothetical protein OHD62_11150 [Mesorhizobium sp. YC-39]|uniref:hypothetical protein n=1 Tax=unclassified Mesorhizobium TaxID=325217 RepID=UPI0021E791E4|nr:MULTISPECIES: hypothetical protein [unclassified Mesorhizobium]MCV3207201.1 hypothetical protein [Mesorhizobium sp. YC-2]MCV3228928.1 hypothetical protein [Mesorhizobium sp. YC-39]